MEEEQADFSFTILIMFFNMIVSAIFGIYIRNEEKKIRKKKRIGADINYFVRTFYIGLYGVKFDNVRNIRSSGHLILSIFS